MSRKWVENLFRPLAVGIMVGCVALAIVELLQPMVPDWNASFFFVACVLVAMEAHYSFRVIQARSEFHTEVWKARAIELATLFILIKLGGYLGDPWAEVVANVRAWPDDLGHLFDAETVAASALALVSWLISTQTARDWQRLDEPSTHHPGERPAFEGLAQRFFWGGGILLAVSGLARTGLTALLDLDRPSISGLVLNVLVYFGLGLFILGQVRFVTLRKAWRAQEIDISAGLAGRWLRYSLAFLALAGLLALLLPTRYTMGLLDAVSRIAEIVFQIVGFIYLLLMFLLSLPMWLLSLLMGKQEGAPPPRLDAPSPQLSRPDRTLGIGWPQWVQAVAFWILALGIASYVLWSYVRGHPEIWKALASFAPLRLLRALWRTLRRRFRSWATTVQRRLRRQAPEERDERAPGATRRFWLGVRSPRERVLYQYLSVLRRARRNGFPRRAPETPREYGTVLKPNLTEVQPEVDSITAAFVEARYSRHPVMPTQVGQAREWSQRIKTALRALRSGRSPGGRRAGRRD